MFASLVQKLRGYAPKNQFARHVSILAGGSALAQLLTVLCSPLLTRLYQPSQIGIFAIFSSLLALTNSLGSLRYERAIPLPKTDRQAAQLLLISLGLLPITAGLLALALRFGGDMLVQQLKAPGLAPYLWLLPLGMFAAGTYLTFSYWFIRTSGFTQIARTKFVQVLNMSLIQVGTGVWHPSPLGLLVGYIVGQAAGVGSFARTFWRTAADTVRPVPWREMAASARTYWRFPAVTAWSQLINAAGLYLPTLLLARYYGTAVAGYYDLGNRVITLPTGLVAVAVSQVYLAEAARLMHSNPGVLVTNFRRLAVKLLWLMLPIAVLAASSPWLFPLIFGRAWATAGMYAMAIALTLVPGTIAISTDNLLTYGYNYWLTGWEIFRLIMVVGSITVCHARGGSALNAVCWLALAATLSYALLYLLNDIAVQRVSRTLAARPADPAAADPEAVPAVEQTPAP